MVNALVFFAAFGVGSVAGASLGLWWIRRCHLRDLRRRAREIAHSPDLRRLSSRALQEAYESSQHRNHINPEYVHFPSFLPAGGDFRSKIRAEKMVPGTRMRNDEVFGWVKDAARIEIFDAMSYLSAAASVADSPGLRIRISQLEAVHVLCTSGQITPEICENQTRDLLVKVFGDFPHFKATAFLDPGEPIGTVTAIEELPSGAIIVTASLHACGPEQSNKIKSETESK